MANTRLAKIQANYEALRIRFIATELDLAITFCDVALSSDKPDTRDRNTKNAQKAYDSAAHFLKESPLPPRVRRAIQRKVNQLEPMLAKLIAQ